MHPTAGDALAQGTQPIDAVGAAGAACEPTCLPQKGGTAFRPYDQGAKLESSPTPEQAGARSQDAQQQQQQQQKPQEAQQQQQQEQGLRQARDPQHTLLLQLQAAQHASQQQQQLQLQALQAQLAQEAGQPPLSMGGSPTPPSEQQLAAALLGRLSGSFAGTTDATGTGLSLGGSGNGTYARHSGPSVFNPYSRPSGGSVGLPGQQQQQPSAGYAAAAAAAAQLLAHHQAPYNIRVSPPQPPAGVVNPFAAGRTGHGAAGFGGGMEAFASPPSLAPIGSSGLAPFAGGGFGGGLGGFGGGGGGLPSSLSLSSPGLGRTPTGSSLGSSIPSVPGGGSGADLAALIAAAAAAGASPPGMDPHQALYQHLLDASQAAQARQLLAAAGGVGGLPHLVGTLGQQAAPQGGRHGSGSLQAPSVDAWVTGRQQESPPQGDFARRSGDFARRSGGSAPLQLSRLSSGGGGQLSPRPRPQSPEPQAAGAPEPGPGGRRARTLKTRKRKSVSEGSDGGGASERAPGRGRGGGRSRDYAALDEKVQRRLAQNREAARKSRQRKKDYMKQLEVELNEKLRRGEIEAAAALAAAPELRTGSSSVARPTMSALQQSLRELSGTQSVGAGSSTLTRSLLAQMMPLHSPEALQQAEPSTQAQPAAQQPKQQPQPQSPFASGGSFEVTAGGGVVAAVSTGGATAPSVGGASGAPAASEPARSEGGPAALASETSFRFASIPASVMPPVSEALAPLLMPVFGGGGASRAPSDDGSDLRETPHGGSQAGDPSGGLAGDPSGGASAQGPGGSRTMSVGSARLQLPGVAATRAQAGLHAEVLAAFDQWRMGHFRTALAVRRRLEAPAADDGELRRLVGTAQNELAAYFQLKRAVLAGESALLAFNGEHLLPAERPYAWLGSLRPSEAAAGLLAKLGDDISAAATGRLHTLQSSLAEQERIIGSGYGEMLASMRARASTLTAAAAGVEPAGPAAGGSYAGLLAAWGQSEVLGRLDAMRMLMQQPDRLWEQFLTEAGRVLPLRQYAVAVIAWAETSLQLQSLHLPWLAALHQAAGGTATAAGSMAAAGPPVMAAASHGAAAGGPAYFRQPPPRPGSGGSGRRDSVPPARQKSLPELRTQAADPQPRSPSLQQHPKQMFMGPPPPPPGQRGGPAAATAEQRQQQPPTQPPADPPAKQQRSPAPHAEPAAAKQGDSPRPARPTPAAEAAPGEAAK